MTTNTKAFIEAREFFERTIAKTVFANPRLTRATPETCPKGVWYDDGQTNDLFKAFLSGISYGEQEERIKNI